MRISKSKNMDDKDEIKRKVIKCCEGLSKEVKELYVGSSVTELDGGPTSALEFHRDASFGLHVKLCCHLATSSCEMSVFPFDNKCNQKDMYASHTEATWR